MNDNIKVNGVIGMVCGAVAGAIMPLWYWETQGQFHPLEPMAWGVTIKGVAVFYVLVGFCIGAIIGNGLKLR